MKKRVKIFASVILALSIFFLIPHSPNAAAKCYNVVKVGWGEWEIWRCTPGPEGCELKNVDEYKEQSDCNRPT